MSDNLSYTVQVKLRLPAEHDGDKRKVEAGGGRWRVERYGEQLEVGVDNRKADRAGYNDDVGQ